MKRSFYKVNELLSLSLLLASIVWNNIKAWASSMNPLFMRNSRSSWFMWVSFSWRMFDMFYDSFAMRSYSLWLISLFSLLWLALGLSSFPPLPGFYWFLSALLSVGKNISPGFCCSAAFRFALSLSAASLVLVGNYLYVFCYCLSVLSRYSSSTNPL